MLLILIVVLPLIIFFIFASQLSTKADTGRADANLRAGMDLARGLYDKRELQTERTLAEINWPQKTRQIRQKAQQIFTDKNLEFIKVSSKPQMILEESFTEILFQRSRGPHLATVKLKKPSLNIEASSTTPEELKNELDRILQNTSVEIINSSTDTAFSQQDNIRSLQFALSDKDNYSIILRTELEESRTFDANALTLIALALLLVVSSLLAFNLRRNLSNRVSKILEGAIKIEKGDYSHKIDASQNDELGKLAQELNKMSERMNSQVELLHKQRKAQTEAIKKIGDAFASGLDKDSIYQIVLESAYHTTQADYGRIITDHVLEEGDHGNFKEVLQELENYVRKEKEPARDKRNKTFLLSNPVLDHNDQLLGVMTLVKENESFSEDEEEMVLYLLNQISLGLENIELHEKLHYEALNDELTGLANHRRFQEAIRHAISSSRRYQKPLSLMILDIDDFKIINDSYGHLEGDKVLKKVARILQEESRESDEAARYGGEEFAIILEETDLQEGKEVAERIRKKIAETIHDLLGSQVRVTTSIGLSQLKDKDSPQDFIAKSDAKLYQSKNSGKNKVSY